MFLRKCKRAKNGKRHTYWALVESYRTARGSRQRIVAYLGELKGKQQSGWAQLGRRLDKKSRPQLSLFDPPHYDEPWDEEFVEVNLKGVRLERLRDFGDVWLGLGLWRLLGLDKLLSDKIPNGREEVPWHIVAAILTLGRFCEPSSELHIEDTWYERTALEDLLGVSPDKVHTDRLYDGLDWLLPRKAWKLNWWPALIIKKNYLYWHAVPTEVKKNMRCISGLSSVCSRIWKRCSVPLKADN